MVQDSMTSWIQKSFTKNKKPTININENQLYRLLKKLKINLAWMNTQTISGDILMIIASWFPWNKKKVQVEFY